MLIMKMIASGIPFSVICSWPWPSPRPAQNWVLLLHTFLLVIYRYNSTLIHRCTSTQVHGRVGESVESALSALAAIFSALSAYFNNFRQNILYFDVSRQKRVLFNCFATKQCLGMLVSSPAHYGSFWLSLAHSGSLLL